VFFFSVGALLSLFSSRFSPAAVFSAGGCAVSGGAAKNYFDLIYIGKNLLTDFSRQKM
jgi:hypothetical protein